MQFIHLDDTEWCFSERVLASHKRRLLESPDFPELIEQISARLKIDCLKRNEKKDKKGYFRIIVTIKLPPKIVDLYFNSASGIRAQYYKSIKKGEQAEQYAHKKLIPVILKKLDCVTKRTCPIDWINKSLNHKFAKLWIHQGLWLRHHRRVFRRFHAGL